MERQTILERLGWRFIRIRGSEYYRDAEQTMQRVKTCAHALMQKREQPDLIDVETIRAALQAYTLKQSAFLGVSS